MRNFIYYICLILFFTSCNKVDDTGLITPEEVSYDINLSLDGDISTALNNTGEVRVLSLSATQEKYLKLVATGIKDIVGPTNISTTLDNENFKITKQEIYGSELRVYIYANENQTDEILQANLTITINKPDDTIYEESFKIFQDKSTIEYEYSIISSINPFVLPSDEGIFEIPFQCKKTTYINGVKKESTASALTGLRYAMYDINTAGIHKTQIIKDGSDVGKYKFIIEGECAYNMQYESKWGVSILNGDSIIFNQSFIHNQTPGDELTITINSSMNSLGVFEF